MPDKIKAYFAKCRDAVTHWFRRCNGADSLGAAIITASLVLTVLARITRLVPLAILAIALYAWAIFRLLSHNKARRMAENGRFIGTARRAKTEVSQAFVRLKNIRKYKYYRCPNCRARLRMPRGVGEKTVTCSQCRHTFRQKA